MKSIKFAAAIAISALVCSTAFAAADQPFSALAGVEAQAMSAPEMHAVYGQLTLLQIQAAIVSLTSQPATGILLTNLNTFVTAHPVQFAQILSVLTSRGF